MAHLALLLAVALAAPTPDHVRVAREFLSAHREKKPDRQAIAAAQRVPYALVVDYLLLLGEPEVAAVLTEMRGSAEQPGLRRLCKAFRRPTREQERALVQAESFTQRGVPEEALIALAAAGEPVAGTVFGVKISWTRARALATAKKAKAYVAELERCAKLAWECGWIHMARDAEKLVARRAPTLKARLAAADRYVDACGKLDDEPESLVAHEVRAQLYRFAASRAKPKERPALWKRMRLDLHEATDLAQRLGKRRREALLRAMMALHWQTEEIQPKQALRLYREAEAILVDLKQETDLERVRSNLAIVLTQLGDYDGAVAILDGLLEGAMSPFTEVQKRALAQRAYAFAGRGSLEQATAAYREALAAAKSPRLLAEAGDVQRRRGDLGEAGRLFEEALALDGKLVVAITGRARVRAARGDDEGARADFASAYALVKDPNERLRLVLLRAAHARNSGRVPEALALVRREIATFADGKVSDYPNAAIAYVVGADLALLAGDREAAVKMIAAGGTLFVRLNQPGHAVTAYAREVLLQVAGNKPKEALMRLQVLLNQAGSSGSDRLKGVAKSAEAIFEARAERPERALELLGEVLAHADRAGDRQLRATALVHKALLAPDDAARLVDQALAELDSIRVRGAEDHPLVEGERPDHAPGIGLHMELKGKAPSAARALRWIERAKADRLQVAFRGRETLLAATLPGELHQAYLAARGRLVEARVAKTGVAAAEAAFDGMVDGLRAQAPGIAAVAFPRPVALAQLQKHLSKDEVLVLMLDDPYARAILAIGNRSAVVAAFDPERPLDAIAGVLKGKRNVIAATDGIWAARPLSSAPFEKGLAYDYFRFYYVASADSFLRLRTAAVRPAGNGLVVVGDAPVPARPVDGIPAFLHLGVPGVLAVDFPQASRIDGNVVELLRRPRPADTVVVPGTRPRPARVVHSEGVTAVVEALRLGGARGVVLSLAGPPPPALLARFYANCLGGGLSAGLALYEAQQWARKNVPGLKPAQWGGLVYFGVP